MLRRMSPTFATTALVALLATAGFALAQAEKGAGKAPAGSKAKTFTVNAGKTTFAILVLSADGQFPEPKADGDKVVVGGQTISYDGGKLALAKKAAAPK